MNAILRFKLLRYFDKLWSLNSKSGIISRLEFEFRAQINDSQRDHEAKKVRYKSVSKIKAAQALLTLCGQIRKALLRVKREKKSSFDMLMGMSNTLKAELMIVAQEALFDNTKHFKAHAGALQVPSDVHAYPELEAFLKSKLWPQIEGILRNRLQEEFKERYN